MDAAGGRAAPTARRAVLRQPNPRPMNGTRAGRMPAGLYGAQINRGRAAGRGVKARRGVTLNTAGLKSALRRAAWTQHRRLDAEPAGQGPPYAPGWTQHRRLDAKPSGQVSPYAPIRANARHVIHRGGMDAAGGRAAPTARRAVLRQPQPTRNEPDASGQDARGSVRRQMYRGRAAGRGVKARRGRRPARRPQGPPYAVVQEAPRRPRRPRRTTSLALGRRDQASDRA